MKEKISKVIGSGEGGGEEKEEKNYKFKSDSADLIKTC